MKTMASRRRSTLDGHPDVNKRRDTQASPGEYRRKIRRLHPPQEDRDLQPLYIEGDSGLHAFHVQ